MAMTVFIYSITLCPAFVAACSFRLLLFEIELAQVDPCAESTQAQPGLVRQVLDEQAG
jgi:hypothetical protein